LDRDRNDDDQTVDQLGIETSQTDSDYSGVDGADYERGDP
jgi:hypothetical protein